jgi:hypothetical protein
MLGHRRKWKDLAPEVFVSRGTTSQSILDKMIKYEKPSDPDQEWRKRVWCYNQSGGSHGFPSSDALKNVGFSRVNFREWKDEKVPCGIGVWHSHGGAHKAYKGSSGDGGVFFYSSDCSKLDNNRPIFHFAGSCHNGKGICPAMFNNGAIGTAGAINISSGGQYASGHWVKHIVIDKMACGESWSIEQGSHMMPWDFVFRFWADPSIKIEPGAPAITITTTKLPDGAVGEPYIATLEAQSPFDEPPFTWSLMEGALPDGLGLDSGTATIAGRPEAEGTYTFQIQVRDSQSSSKKEFSIIIGPAPDLAVTTESLLIGVAGETYTDTLTATGGTEPYTWSIENSANMPAGLLLDSETGEIAGTPTDNGAFTFTAKVVDSTDNTAQETTKQLTITILPEGSDLPLQITTGGFLPDAVINETYSTTLTAIGGKEPYTWSITADSLPEGLEFDNSTGGISGAPAEIGIFSFTANVIDQENSTDTKDCSLFVYTTGTGASPGDDGESSGGCSCSVSEYGPNIGSVMGILIPYLLLISFITGVRLKIRISKRREL